ncbi:RecX family transcriptional regulator [Candidatus Saccharibacteria bacterium]|nr:RecX family transcriptional regulator [Candidatus Saccharibacteria bacterium]
MPVVTTITRQKKRDTRYSIKIDGEYSFSLSDLDLSNSSLRVGTQLSDAEVVDWQRRSGDSMAYDLALRYISIRRRSTAEIERYLIRKEYDESVIRDIISRLTEIGLLDDEDFAAAWIRDRQLLRPRSVQALKFELMRLGLSRDVIDSALAKTGGDEIEVVAKLIERRQRQYPEREKLMAYLARQGFRYDQIKLAFERISEQ